MILRALESTCHYRWKMPPLSQTFCYDRLAHSFLQIVRTQNKFHIQVISQHRTRGHSWKIVKQRNCLDLRKYFFSARVVDGWNRLDQKDIDVCKWTLPVG